MSYSIDYRQRVISFIEAGGSKAQASRLFNVHPTTIYEWWGRKSDLSPRPAKTRRGKIDKEALCRHVADHPDALLRERADHFGVTTNAIWEMMRKLGFVKKSA